MNRTFLWVSLIGFVLGLLLVAGCGSNSSSSEYVLKLEPNGLTVKAGSTATISPTVLLNDAPVENPQLTWSADAQVGTITSAGLFTAVTTTSSVNPVTGFITCSGYGKTAKVPVTVTVGDLDHIVIIPPAGVNLAQVASGTSLTFTAVGEDSLGNRGTTRIAVTPTWSVTGGIGAISADGVFQAGTPGTGTVVATVTGVPSASVEVTVVTGPAQSLTINFPSGFDPQNMKIGDQVTFTASISDGNGNQTPVTLAWEISGGIGTITADGLFTATQAGSGSISGSYNGLTASLALRVTKAITGQIVFVKEDTNANLCLLKTDGTLQELSTGSHYYTSPSWMHDEKSVLFVSQGAPLNGICTMDTTTGIGKQIYASRGQDPQLSPDGNTIVFSNGLVAAGEIDLITSTGTFIKKIATGVAGNPRYPTWSPQGTKVAFCVNMGLGLTDGLYVVDINGTPTTKKIYSGKVRQVVWSQNANNITFSDDNGIYVIPANGGTRAKLVNEPDGITGGYCIAPDNSAVVYGVRDAHNHVQLRMHILSTHTTYPLTNFTNASATSPTWSN
ncbi:MAG: TolB family protein [Armatimonadota bacterium]